MLHKKLAKSNYHITYPVFLLLFLVGGLILAVTQAQLRQQSQSKAATGTDCTVNAAKFSVKQTEQELFNLVNDYRKQNNVAALSWDATLKQAAAWQSIDMLAHSNLNHTDSLGRDPGTRLKNCGYTNTNYGENIAEGEPNSTGIFTSWKNSPPHNTIMLSPDYSIVGIDAEVDSTGKISYWTMDFGTATGSSPSATISLSPTTSGTPMGTPAPTADPNVPTPTAAQVGADIQINVKVKIAGIGKDGNIYPKHLTRKITAYVYGTAADPVTTGTGYLTYDNNNYFTGTLHLGKLAEGAYLIKFAGDNTLQVLAKPEFQNLTIAGDNIISPVTLYQGDMNGDNVLNIDDYNLVLPCFQDKRCDQATSIDFNDDGTTDVTDYNLLLQSFEQLRGN